MKDWRAANEFRERIERIAGINVLCWFEFGGAKVGKRILDMAQLILEWTGVDLPVCPPGTRVGLQRGKEEVVDAQPLTAGALHFRFEVTVKPDTQDFAGPFVQGKRGERFVYLVWRTDFQNIGRSKIGLNTTLPWTLVEECLAAGGPLAATIRLRNDKGQPALASLKSQMIEWRVG